MLRRTLLATAGASLLLPIVARAAQNTSLSAKETIMDAKANTSGYAEVNGLNLYYEIRGAGRPLILLHGGLGALDMFGPTLDALAQGRQVIAVDLQAHGRTADIDRPMSYPAMADDIAKLAAHLNLDRPDIMGYSLGGGVALRCAIDHGEAFGKLVLVSTPYARSGWTEANLAGMSQLGAAAAEPMKNTPMYGLYSAIAPRPHDWPVLLEKTGRLLAQDYDWAQEVKTIKNRVMLVVGDADSVKLAHATAFFALLGGGLVDGGWDGSGMTAHRMAVLPGVTHYQIFMLPVLTETVTPFLDTPSA